MKVICLFRNISKRTVTLTIQHCESTQILFFISTYYTIFLFQNKNILHVIYLYNLSYI